MEVVDICNKLRKHLKLTYMIMTSFFIFYFFCMGWENKWDKHACFTIGETNVCLLKVTRRN